MFLGQQPNFTNYPAICQNMRLLTTYEANVKERHFLQHSHDK